MAIGRLRPSSWHSAAIASLRAFLAGRAMNGTSFRAYVEYVRAPTLKRGDIVIRTTLASTRSPASAKLSKHAVPSCSTCRQPRPQPDRTILLETQGAAAQGGSSFNRQLMGGRLVPRRFLAKRMRRIPHQCRIWSHKMSVTRDVGHTRWSTLS